MKKKTFVIMMACVAVAGLVGCAESDDGEGVSLPTSPTAPSPTSPTRPDTSSCFDDVENYFDEDPYTGTLYTTASLGMAARAPLRFGCLRGCETWYTET